MAGWLLAASAWAGTVAFTAAHAVNDLPGGPAVNQLNLHPPVTRIAQDQAWLRGRQLPRGGLGRPASAEQAAAPPRENDLRGDEHGLRMRWNLWVRGTFQETHTL